MFSKGINKKDRKEVLMYFRSTSKAGIPDIKKIELKLKQQRLSKSLRKALEGTKKDMENRGVSFAKAMHNNSVISQSDKAILENSSSQEAGFNALLQGNKNSNEMLVIVLLFLFMPTLSIAGLYFSYDIVVEGIKGITDPLEQSLQIEFPLPKTYESKTPYTILFYSLISFLVLITTFFQGTYKYAPKLHNTIFRFSGNQQTTNIVYMIYNLAKAGISTPIIFETLAKTASSPTEKIFFETIYKQMQTTGKKEFVKVGANKLGLDSMVMEFIENGDSMKSDEAFKTYLQAAKDDIDARIASGLETLKKIAPVTGMLISIAIWLKPILDLSIYFSVGLPGALMGGLQ